MSTLTFDKVYDTNGGANRFFVKDGSLFVWGHSVQGSYELTGKDSSAFLAKLWGGTLLSNGDVGNNAKAPLDGRTPELDNPAKVKIATSGDGDLGKTFKVATGNLNVSETAGATKTIGATLDLGPQFVGGKEKFGFASAKDASNFLAFLKDLKAVGLLDDVM